MKNIIICFFTILFFYSCVPNRIGKVKWVNNGTIERVDSIYLLNPFYTYSTFGNPITCCDWYKPSEKQIEIEGQWDSIQTTILNKYFATNFIRYGNRNSNYNRRPYIFKFFHGFTEKIASDSVSYKMLGFVENIQGGDTKETQRYLPDSIYKLSFQQPVTLITYDFTFYEIGFRALYASGSTGLRLISYANVVIVSNGEVAYYRNYRNAYSYDRLESKPHIKEKIVHKLFDKLN